MSPALKKEHDDSKCNCPKMTHGDNCPVHRKLTREQIKEWVLSMADLSNHLTENGFSLAYGFDESDLPTRTHYGHEGEMIRDCLNEIIGGYSKLKNIVDRLQDYVNYECNPAYTWSAKKVYDDLNRIIDPTYIPSRPLELDEIHPKSNVE